ncbi:hypothetical protein [Burkholderia ubonensis]|uniref:hypothetical protein n=1 Tax=Burkholderia ubonensis TaxID=101571 RepID=UPI0012F7587B|nr:hypothetical protein [Burkholderia ubonensis]
MNQILEAAREESDCHKGNSWKNRAARKPNWALTIRTGDTPRQNAAGDVLSTEHATSS